MSLRALGAGAALLLLSFGCRGADRPVPGMELAGGPLSDEARAGRAVFLSERCGTCHIRGAPAPADFRGSAAMALGRRIGPALADVGGRMTDRWHHLHLRDPRRLRPGSTMPAYPWLYDDAGLPNRRARELVAYLQAQRDPNRRDAARAVESAMALEPSAADPEAGARVFARSCSGCHGAEGRGVGPAAPELDPPPADLGAADWKLVPRGDDGRPERRLLTELVARGVPGTEMHGHDDLRPEDLAAVVEHARALPPPGEPEPPPPPLERGDPARDRTLGRGLYLALGCTRCHASDGRGTPLGGSAAVLVGSHPPKTGTGLPALARAVWRGRPGSAMPAAGPALTQLTSEMVRAQPDARAADDLASLEALAATLDTLLVEARLTALVVYLAEGLLGREASAAPRVAVEGRRD